MTTWHLCKPNSNCTADSSLKPANKLPPPPPPPLLLLLLLSPEGELVGAAGTTHAMMWVCSQGGNARPVGL
jgi:hypothetical protein